MPRLKGEKKRGVPLKDGRSLGVDFSKPKPKAGSRYSVKDARVMGPELIRLCTKAGITSPAMLSAKDVVEAAREKSNPLHSYIFDLNDEDAAENYRLDIARKICREITFEVVFTDSSNHESQHEGQFYIHLGAGERDKEGYHPLPDVLSMESLRVQMIRKAQLELERWWDRYQLMFKLEHARSHYDALKKALED